MGGAECSTAGNPLSQFTKHVQDDKSLQRDRLVNGGPAAASHSFRTVNMNAPQDEVRYTTPFLFLYYCLLFIFPPFLKTGSVALSSLGQTGNLGGILRVLRYLGPEIAEAD